MLVMHFVKKSKLLESIYDGWGSHQFVTFKTGHLVSMQELSNKMVISILLCESSFRDIVDSTNWTTKNEISKSAKKCYIVVVIFCNVIFQPQPLRLFSTEEFLKQKSHLKQSEI